MDKTPWGTGWVKLGKLQSSRYDPGHENVDPAQDNDANVNCIFFAFFPWELGITQCNKNKCKKYNVKDNVANYTSNLLPYPRDRTPLSQPWSYLLD